MAEYCGNEGTTPWVYRIIHVKIPTDIKNSVTHQPRATNFISLPRFSTASSSIAVISNPET